MTVIDFHTHVFPEKIAARAIASLSAASHTVPFSDGTAQGLLQKADAAGIEKSVVLPVVTNPDKTVSVNDYSRAQTGSRLIYFGGMHPLFNGWKSELARLADAGIKGIKVHPVYQGVALDDLRFLRILDRAAELGLTVVTHAGDDIGFPGAVFCSPEMARNALRQVGKVHLVLAHMGGWHCWERVCDLLCDTGCFLDTSFSLGKIVPCDDHYKNGLPQLLSTQQATAIVKNFGADRVLFGTDSPWSDLADSIRAVRQMDLDDGEFEMIFHSNAARLLGL